MVSVAVVASRTGAAKGRPAVWPISARSSDTLSPKMGVLAPAPPSFNAKTSGSLAISEAVVTSMLPRLRYGPEALVSRTSDGGPL